ncbi:nuclear transport factor 2 family protein [Chitinilyticum aquatile]|uniref:nuclear transport factor 2 family protein n=1 Tax=Chitinilyticum aquatile TaxID=362520 RepID=UPI0009D795B0|nr:nuclear transport factor 2 family protein [Chitinilyticum aquatile]
MAETAATAALCPAPTTAAPDCPLEADTLLAEGLARVLACYAALDLASIPALAACYAPEARFRDPFNDVRGREAIAAIFRHMFAAVAQPQFRILRHWRTGQDAMVEWQFDFVLRGKALSFDGCSRLVLGTDGLVHSHLDYWDAASGLYAHLPLVGGLMGWLAARMR